MTETEQKDFNGLIEKAKKEIVKTNDLLDVTQDNKVVFSKVIGYEEVAKEDGTKEFKPQLEKKEATLEGAKKEDLQLEKFGFTEKELKETPIFKESDEVVKYLSRKRIASGEKAQLRTNIGF